MLDITRRRFLGHLGIVTGAVATTTAAVAVERAIRPEENPELLRLGEELKEKAAAFEAADAEEASRARYYAIESDVPEELVIASGGWLQHATETERDLDNKAVSKETTPRGSIIYRQIAASYHLERIVAENDGRTLRGKCARKLLKLANQYEGAVADAKEASGWDRAELAQYHAAHDIRSLAEGIFEAEARTMAGVEIKARMVLVLMLNRDDTFRFYHTKYGPALAQSVIAVAGGRA